MTRRLDQTDVVVGEKRLMPVGHEVVCDLASDTHVAYHSALAPEQRTIRRDVWCSWPVVAEAER